MHLKNLILTFWGGFGSLTFFYIDNISMSIWRLTYFALTIGAIVNAKKYKRKKIIEILSVSKNFRVTTTPKPDIPLFCSLGGTIF